MKRTLIPAALFALSCCIPVQAQAAAAPGTEDRVKRRLDRLDKDGDGKISSGEAVGPVKRNFTRIDTNQDGVLDQNELARLAERVARGEARRKRRRRPPMTTEELLKRAPPSVVVEPDIAYREGASTAWRLDLVRPKDRGRSPRPGLVFVHGGAWRSGDKRTGTFLQGAFGYAQKGYVCITVNYRLLGEATLTACVEDVKNAVRWFRGHAKKYNVNPKRIGGYGNSAGAHLVAMLGLVGPDAGLEGDGPYQEQSSLLAAVCASATPTDLGDRAPKLSPIKYVRADAPPFLLIHGTADDTVNVSHGDRFVEALRKAGAQDVTYIRIEGAGHGVFNQHAATTHPAMEAFFERILRGRRTQAGEAGDEVPAYRRVEKEDIKEILLILGQKGLAAGLPEEIRGYERIFRSLDLDHDAKLTKTEFIDKGRYGTRRMREGIFRATDRNGDGYITEREYVDNRIITDEAKRVFASFDQNGDNRVTPEEFVTKVKTPHKEQASLVFKKLDSDADGGLGMIEYLVVLGDWARRATQRSAPLRQE